MEECVFVCARVCGCVCVCMPMWCVSRWSLQATITTTPADESVAEAAIICRCTSYLFDCFQSMVVHHFTITQASADSFLKKCCFPIRVIRRFPSGRLEKKSPGNLFWLLTIFIPSLIIHASPMSVETRAGDCGKRHFQMIHEMWLIIIQRNGPHKSILDIPTMVYSHSGFLR